MICVSGVHEEAQDEDIYERFAEYGDVKNLHLNLDRRTGYVKGYCFIEYEHRHQAAAAIDAENGEELLDQKIYVSWAFLKPAAVEREGLGQSKEKSGRGRGMTSRSGRKK